MATRKSVSVLVPEEVLPPPAIRGYKQLLRLIRADRLRPGDRLPTQPQLRQRLNLGNDTISAMMSMLTSSGAITRKSRVGTVLQDPQRLPQPTWVVGVGTFPAPTKGPSSFFAELALRLQVEFARHDMRSLPYFRFIERSPVRLADFRHLATDLEQQQLDGFVTMLNLEPAEWQQLEDQGLPLTHACSTRPTTDGLLLDQATMVQEAVAELVGAGCRTLGLVVRAPGRKPRHPAEAAFLDACQSAGLSSHQAHCLEGGISLEGGQRLADQLIHQPAKGRPDGLILLDEYVALALLDRLRRQGDYRPRSMVACTQQAALQFALPVTRFEIDVDRFARRCAKHFLARLADPTRGCSVEPLAPQRAPHAN